MALTMADLAEQSSDPFDKGVLEKFALTSDILRLMPWKQIDGDKHKYRQQDILSGVGWRRVNEPISESTGKLATREEPLGIISGQFFVDKAEKRFMRKGGDSIDLVAEQAAMKSSALARELERAIFEGDPLVDPDEIMGFRPRCTGDQVMLAGAGGATMTLAMMDALIDAVAANVGSLHFFTSKAVRRKWTNLAKATGGSVQIQYQNVSKLGDQISHYDGIPIHVVEDAWDASTILDAEDPGDGTADTYSVYLVAFGEEEGVYGIINGDGPMVDCYKVTDETESGPPGELWRIEMYPGLVRKHPRSIARTRGLLLA